MTRTSLAVAVVATLAFAAPAHASLLVYELSPFDKANTPEECFNVGGGVLCWFATDWDITGNFVPLNGASEFKLYVLENHALFTYTGARHLEWVELRFEGPAFTDVEPDENGFIAPTGLDVDGTFFDDPGTALLTGTTFYLDLSTVFDDDPYAEIFMTYAAVTPEPSLLVLLAIGAGVAGYRRRRR